MSSEPSLVAADAHDLTAAWLSNALRSSGHDVTVHAVRHERIGTGQIGANYRLHLDAEGAVPGTLVAKIAAGTPEARMRVRDGYKAEVRFYRELVGHTAVNTPTCWHAAISDDFTAFTLLMDDLAPAVPGVQTDGCTVTQAAAAVVNLAGLHGPVWNSPLLDEAAQWLPSPSAEVGAFAGAVLQDATEQFIQLYAAELDDADKQTLRDAAVLVGPWTTAGEQPLSLVHGDYRLDNLMFHPDGVGVVAVDWQTAQVGPPARDLAYFLETSLLESDRRAHEGDLVIAYANAIASHGVAYTAEQALVDYRLGMLHGPLITVLGRIYATGVQSRQSDAMFLAMATRSCAAIRELETLELINSLRE